MSTDFDLCFIKHFAEYYKPWNFISVTFILHSIRGNQLKEGANKIKEHWPEVKLVEWLGKFRYEKKIDLIQMCVETLPKDDWVFTPDVDEFYRKPNGELWKLAFKNVIYGHLYDRKPNGVASKELTDEPNIFIQFPIEDKPGIHTLSPKLEPAHMKVGFFKAYHQYHNCHVMRTAPYKLFMQEKEPIIIDHFCWTKNRIAKIEDRMKMRGKRKNFVAMIEALGPSPESAPSDTKHIRLKVATSGKTVYLRDLLRPFWIKK